MLEIERVQALLKATEQTERGIRKEAAPPFKVGVDLGTASIVIVVLDAQDRPVACARKNAQVLRDGVVVDYFGAQQIVRELKAQLEERLGHELTDAAIAMPGDTESSAKTHRYVVEGAGFEVTRVLDEPTAANAVYRIRDGAVVDIGGGTTGLAIFQGGRLVATADEPTGGTHLSLVIAGNQKISLEEAERRKTDPNQHKALLPIVRPVLEKMATIVMRHIRGHDVQSLYLCGGTCCFSGVDRIFAAETGLSVSMPENPLLVTPLGIALLS